MPYTASKQISEELRELIDSAIYKEIASQAFYEAAQKATQDPGALTLMKQLARQEIRHSRELQKLKDGGMKAASWSKDSVPNLMLSDYLTGGESPEGAGLQDLLIIAMKREGEAVRFYTDMTALVRGEKAKSLCESLVRWELRHKLRLEMMYDNLYYKED